MQYRIKIVTEKREIRGKRKWGKTPGQWIKLGPVRPGIPLFGVLSLNCNPKNKNAKLKIDSCIRLTWIGKNKNHPIIQ